VDLRREAGALPLVEGADGLPQDVPGLSVPPGIVIQDQIRHVGNHKEAKVSEVFGSTALVDASIPQSSVDE
jgi:hypothetical protein